MNKDLIYLVRNILREEGSWAMLQPQFDDLVRFDLLDEPTILVPNDEFVHGMTKLCKKISRKRRISPSNKKRLEIELKSLDSNGYVSNTDSSIFEYEKIFESTEDGDDMTSVDEMYQKERISGKLEAVPEVLDLLRRLSEHEISIGNSDIHESMKTEMLRSKDGDIPKSAENLLLEYDNENESAINRIIDMAKDPSRRSLAEKVQKSWAKKHGVFLEKLPDKSNKSIRILNGKFYEKGKLSSVEQAKATKSMDFKIQNTLENVYLYCKYTKEGGGSQDNIISDVKLVINEFESCEHAKVLLVLDGGYWDKKRLELINHNNNLMIISSDDYNNNKVRKFMNLT